jgi:plasmid stabilization system protein ParE
MANDVFLTVPAQHHIALLQEYLSHYSVASADKALAEIGRALRVDIAPKPAHLRLVLSDWLAYRARLFRIFRRTQFWIIYEFRDDIRRIDVLRIWNASRNPAAFEL